MKRHTITLLFVFAALVAPLSAQTPTTIVVPAASARTQPQVRSAVTADANDSAKILQQLQQMKAANEETIRKQEAVLQQLDELQKAAEQLRVFSSRS